MKRGTLRLDGCTLAEWLSLLAERDPTPAGGSLALVTLAGAAALAAKAARLSGRDPAGFTAQAVDFLQAARTDAEAYAQLRGGDAAARRRFLEEGMGQLEEALSFLDRLDPLFDGVSPSLAPDLAAAVRLARPAARTLLLNLVFNASRWLSGEGDPILARLSALEAEWGGR